MNSNTLFDNLDGKSNIFNRDYSATICVKCNNEEQHQILIEKLINTMKYSAIIIITDEKEKYNNIAEKYGKCVEIFDTKFAKKEYYYSAKQSLAIVGREAKKLIIFDSELYSIGSDGFIADSLMNGHRKNQDTLIIMPQSKNSMISSDFNVIFEEEKYICKISTKYDVYRYNFINDMIEKLIGN